MAAIVLPSEHVQHGLDNLIDTPTLSHTDLLLPDFFQTGYGGAAA